MGRTVYTPESIPLTQPQQEEFANGWLDLESEESPFYESSSENESLEDRCRAVISVLPETASKKDQLIALYITLNDGESMISPRVAADVVDCTLQYARSFNYVIDERKVVEGNGIDPRFREHILSNDDNLCVRCGSGEELEIHHIIPYVDGGKDTVGNLVTLCNSCHQDAHVEGWRKVGYENKEEFWQWVES